MRHNRANSDVGSGVLRTYSTTRLTSSIQKPEIEIPVLYLVNELFEIVDMGIEYDLHNSRFCGNLISRYHTLVISSRDYKWYSLQPRMLQLYGIFIKLFKISKQQQVYFNDGVYDRGSACRIARHPAARSTKRLNGLCKAMRGKPCRLWTRFMQDFNKEFGTNFKFPSRPKSENSQ